MNLSAPIATVIPGAFGVVIEQLAMTETEYTRAGLAKRCAGRVGKSRVYELLEEMTASGLVIKRELEEAKFYSLNRAHILAGPILQLAATREIFLDRVRQELAAWSPAPEAAYLFGSVARGSSSLGSDVDVLLVRSDSIAEADEHWNRQRFDLELAIERWTGNAAHIVEYSESQWRELIAQGQALTVEIFESSLILFGNSEMRDNEVAQANG
jgi:predicted nucleotidyltransferase